MAYYCWDIDGTADADPPLMREMMTALRAAGHRVDILTGISADEVTDTDLAMKRNYLNELGISQGVAYATLYAVAKPHDLNKAAFCQDNGVDCLIDNDKVNAKACAAMGVLVLVPWATRQ